MTPGQGQGSGLMFYRTRLRKMDNSVVMETLHTKAGKIRQNLQVVREGGLDLNPKRQDANEGGLH